MNPTCSHEKTKQNIATWLFDGIWYKGFFTLQWRYDERDSVSNQRRLHCSTVGSGADQRKRQSSALLAFVRGIHRWPVNSTRKRPVKRKMLPFDDVITLQRWSQRPSIFVSVVEYKIFFTQSERYEIKYGLRPFQYMLVVLRVTGSYKIPLNRSKCFIGIPV